jgi:hypothetical protein
VNAESPDYTGLSSSGDTGLAGCCGRLLVSAEHDDAEMASGRRLDLGDAIDNPSRYPAYTISLLGPGFR